MGQLSVILLCSVLVSCYGNPAPVVYDTIVVGLGASGTAAASTLAKAGKKVLALEAQNRVGGRVNTVPFGDGVVELGAEWIHGTEGSSNYELAVTNNVTVLVQEVDMKVYRSDGSSDKENIILELTNYATELYENPPDDAEPSLGQFLTRKIHEYIKEKHPSVQNDTEFINNYLNFLDGYIDTYESSDSWNEVATKSSYKDLGGSLTASWHTYGYKTVFEILLNKYNNGPGYPTLEIKLNTEVTQIQWPQDPNDNVVVTTKDGSTYTAKNVIVTVSVGVLKESYNTLFSPALPEDKIRSFQSISMGVCNKIIFRFAQTWWPANTVSLFVWRDADKASVSETDKWLLSVNAAGSSMASPTALTLWTCGRNTAKQVETLSDEVLRTKGMGLIRKFMGVGRTVPEPIEMLKSSWFSNPFTRGSYTFDDVSSHLHPTARADLAQPLVDSSGAPRVLFAGEATESTHFGTVHGAIDTGRREANRLLSVGSN